MSVCILSLWIAIGSVEEVNNFTHGVLCYYGICTVWVDSRLQTFRKKLPAPS